MRGASPSYHSQYYQSAEARSAEAGLEADFLLLTIDPLFSSVEWKRIPATSRREAATWHNNAISYNSEGELATLSSFSSPFVEDLPRLNVVCKAGRERAVGLMSADSVQLVV
ncbi:hypothetical protein [Pyrobaculum sp.]|uniref:hypothetical protein n=1 Tax=Pyrobaculum sp. TaxID=2004705 RepID=UPI003D0D6FD8